MEPRDALIVGSILRLIEAGGDPLIDYDNCRDRAAGPWFSRDAGAGARPDRPDLGLERTQRRPGVSLHRGRGGLHQTAHRSAEPQGCSRRYRAPREAREGRVMAGDEPRPGPVRERVLACDRASQSCRAPSPSSSRRACSKRRASEPSGRSSSCWPFAPRSQLDDGGRVTPWSETSGAPEPAGRTAGNGARIADDRASGDLEHTPTDAFAASGTRPPASASMAACPTRPTASRSSASSSLMAARPTRPSILRPSFCPSRVVTKVRCMRRRAGWSAGRGTSRPCRGPPALVAEAWVKADHMAGDVVHEVDAARR